MCRALRGAAAAGFPGECDHEAESATPLREAGLQQGGALVQGVAGEPDPWPVAPRAVSASRATAPAPPPGGEAQRGRPLVDLVVPPPRQAACSATSTVDPPLRFLQRHTPPCEVPDGSRERLGIGAQTTLLPRRGLGRGPGGVVASGGVPGRFRARTPARFRRRAAPGRPQGLGRDMPGAGCSSIQSASTALGSPIWWATSRATRLRASVKGTVFRLSRRSTWYPYWVSITGLMCPPRGPRRLPELVHPVALASGLEEALAARRAGLLGQAGRGLREVGAAFTRARAVPPSARRRRARPGSPALGEEEDVPHGELELGVGAVARLQDVVSHAVLLQREVGGEEVEEAVVLPSCDEGRPQLRGGGVRHRQRERREMSQRPAPGLREAEELVLGVGDRSHGERRGSGLAARGDGQGEECSAGLHPINF